MKPIRLTMQAFESYKEKTVIDFTKPNQNLFLITGDTGAGKTTIFDAIVYALYGEASSSFNRKDGVELQSQYADLTVEPYVELVFTEGTPGSETDADSGAGRSGYQSDHSAGVGLSGTTGYQREYCVHRSPRHIRAAKRKGVRDQIISESVTLTMPDGTSYPQKETDGKLVEIVGLTKDQFMQVAMIAQGEFMELLRADSNRKRDIFRKLFHTGLYQDLVDALNARRSAQLTQIGQIRTACQQETGHIVAPEGYETSASLTEEKRRILSSDRLNVADMEALLTDLQALCTALTKDRDRVQVTVAACSRERDTRRDRYTSGQTLLKSFDQLAHAQEELAACAAAEPSIQGKEELIRKIQAAYDIKAVCDRYQDACAAVEQTEKSLTQERAALPVLTRGAEEAAQAEQTAKAAADAALASYTAVTERVNKALQVLEALAAAKEEVQKLENAERESKAAAETASAAKDAFEAKERDLRQRESTLSEANTKLALWENEKKEAEEIGKDLAAARKEQTVLKAQKEKARAAAGAYQEAREAYEKGRAEYNRANDAFLDAQAGFLAKTLQEGEPCPVCGSRNHPHPASYEEGESVLSREQIEALAEKAAGLESARSQAAAASGAEAKGLEEKEQQAGRMMEKVSERLAAALENTAVTTEKSARSADGLTNAGDVATDSADSGMKQTGETAAGGRHGWTLEEMDRLLSDWKKALQKRGKALQADAAALREIQTFFRTAAQEKERLQKAAEETAAAAVAAGNALTRGRTEQRGLEQQKDYETGEAARAAAAAARKEQQKADAAYQGAKKAQQKAEAARNHASTLIGRYEEQLPLLRKEAEDRKGSYEAAMAEKDFSAFEWQSVIQEHEKKETTALQKEITAYNNRKSAALGALEAAQKTIGEQKKPDLEQLAAERDEAQERLDESQAQLNQLTALLQTDAGAYRTLAPKMQERAEIMEEYTRIDSLYERLAGRRTGARMDIETFVQRYYLERILHAANARFGEMSAGQYELRLVREDLAGEGKNRGLDLMVYSTVTGKVREIRTLSGGESFMAALSLALGMADQIQESVASIHLDMMFIDEGFGSLDDHARDQAVRVLQQMAGGSRLIGIISHVSELKQEIEDQLLVEKDEDGSHVHWQIS